ncbi:MAG: rhodanese-like domain-containing protein [Deltaproteobacteria bacterium]|nr:rhodanese-like domain-containing protein [Deltaproteobacteria bacterium]
MMRSTLRQVMILLTTMCCILSIAGAEPPTDLAETVRQEAADGKYQLIDVENLWELYQDSSREILLIDTRQGWEYRTGHIAGAEHFSMEPTWFSRLIQRHALAQALGSDKSRILIFY